MFWDRKDDQAPESVEDHHSPQRRKLTGELQKLLDQEDLLDQIYEGQSADSVNTNVRYAAYGSRIRTILLSAHRYVAYTSDIGESFRPVAHPWLVRGAYGISWAYILGDVANEGYKAYLRNRTILAPQCEAFRKAIVTPITGGGSQAATAEVRQRHLQDSQEQQTLTSTTSEKHPITWKDPEADTLTPWPTLTVPLSEDYRSVMAERLVFQALASMGLPALTIHSMVKYSGRAMKGLKSTFLRTWGPIGLGLSVVPFLPYAFDKPVEHAVEWSFRQLFLAIGGPDAVSQPSAVLRNIEETKQRRKEEKDRRREERLRREKEE
ncbi:hypothetical protein FQN57_006532 [Myotisia sp. PD_48]|nr:hypothetical protein FQN57_006532 [Myotisia sp. PD_48]